MRVWDVSPGYLHRQSLLAEHRELHGLHSILEHGKTGYSRHPETMRWAGCLSGLRRRHALLAAEMELRGYVDRTPLAGDAGIPAWPQVFVTPPSEQYSLLSVKYRRLKEGRIPLPRSAQELWAHHKYSVMARDPAAYRSIGARVSRLRRGAALLALSEDLVFIVRQDPAPRALVNALEHMWGYVSKAASPAERRQAQSSAANLFLKTRELAIRSREPYLTASTALCDLAPLVSR